MGGGRRQLKACGKSGNGLAWKHILKNNAKKTPGDRLTPDERSRLAKNIKGYGISPDMLALEERAQGPVLAVFLAPESAAVLQFRDGGELGVILDQSQVGAQVSIGYPWQIEHWHLVRQQTASLPVCHHAEPGARPGALQRFVVTQREDLRHGRLQVNQHAFPVAPFVGPQDSDWR